MPQYFFKFPKLLKNNVLLTDLTTRIKVRDKYLDNDDLYYIYEFQEGDTAEILASKYYGSPELHWIILVTNMIFDPNFDFPMPSDVFYKYIDDKYKNNSGVSVLRVENVGTGYTTGVYKRVPLMIKNPEELNTIGEDILVDLGFNSGGIEGNVRIVSGGKNYDANTIFTIDNSYVGGFGTGAEFSISSFMNSYEYAQTTIDPIFGYAKENRIIAVNSVSYEISTLGELTVTSIPYEVLSKTYFYVDEDSYYNLYEGSDPHPGIMVTLTDGNKVIYDTIRVPPKTIYQRELDDNDNKRVIKILKKEYYPQVLKEFIQLMATTYA